MITIDLPNFEERRAPIDMLVFHCLAYDPNEGIETFRQAGVSAHYMIARNGRIFRLADEQKCAWHAGVSSWKGRTGINQHSIGIELCSPSFGQEPYDFRQIKALIRLSHRLIRQYHIRPENIVGHSDVAPSRKADPGKAFPWAYLARHGIGLWPDSKTPTAIGDMETLLKQIGYDTTVLSASVWAFCRRFLPEIVASVSDVQFLIDHPNPSDLPPEMKRVERMLAKVSGLYR